MQELHLHNIWSNDSDVGALGNDVVIAHFPCVLGRHQDCDYRLNLSLISRHHCTFYQRGEEVWVHDMGSRNGTWLNGEPVTGPSPLKEGDRLELARLPFVVHLGAGVRETAASPTSP
jgi:predicted component of type VI protein secretion system